MWWWHYWNCCRFKFPARGRRPLNVGFARIHFLWVLIDSKTDSHDGTQLLFMKFLGSICFIGLLIFPNNLEELLRVSVFFWIVVWPDWLLLSAVLECILRFFLVSPIKQTLAFFREIDVHIITYISNTWCSTCVCVMVHQCSPLFASLLWPCFMRECVAFAVIWFVITMY